MKHLKKYNESIRDQMTPKSEEEILDGIDNFIENTEKRMDNGEDFVYDDVLDLMEYIKQIKKIDTRELIHLIIDEIDLPDEEKLNWIFGIGEDTYGDEVFDANSILLLLKVMKKK